MWHDVFFLWMSLLALGADNLPLAFCVLDICADDLAKECLVNFGLADRAVHRRRREMRYLKSFLDERQKNRMSPAYGIALHANGNSKSPDSRGSRAPYKNSAQLYLSREGIYVTINSHGSYSFLSLVGASAFWSLIANHFSLKMSIYCIYVTIYSNKDHLTTMGISARFPASGGEHNNPPCHDTLRPAVFWRIQNNKNADSFRRSINMFATRKDVRDAFWTREERSDEVCS